MKKYFITGLVILLPVAVTIAVVIFIVNLLTEPFMGLVSNFLDKAHILNKGFLFLSPEQLLRYGSKLLVLILLFAVTIGVGMVTRWFFIHTLLKISDQILHKIPIVNMVYKTTQEIIKTLFVTDKNTFKQVVMVPYPQDGTYVVGLLVREAPEACCKVTGEEMFSVLVPTTPNPTTGFLMMYRKSQLVFLDMKPEQAIKMIVSCGVIVPESENKTGAT